MTITTTGAKKVFSANGATTVFGWDFYVPDQASLVVQSVAADGALSTITTGFTVTGLGTSTGAVTFAVAPANGTQIVLSRSVAQTQGTDLTNQDGFYPEVLEAALDKLTMLIQQNSDAINRSIKSSIADTGTLTLPTAAARAGQLLGFDSFGNAIPGGNLPSNLAAVQAACEAARDAALAAYDSFDDRFLGSKTSNPTLDNDGNALIGGALYYNSVAQEIRLWTGSAWVAAYVSGAGYLQVANVFSELAGVLSTARTNLGLGTGNNVAFNTVADAKGEIRRAIQNGQTASYTLVVGDAGKSVWLNTTTGLTLTVPNAVFSAGDMVTIVNTAAGNQTIAQGTSLTLTQAGTTNTGNRTLSQNGCVTIIFISSSAAIIAGSGLS